MVTKRVRCAFKFVQISIKHSGVNIDSTVGELDPSSGPLSGPPSRPLRIKNKFKIEIKIDI
jgi:hypothetical protein